MLHHRTTKPLRFPPPCIVKVKQDFIDLCSKGHLHFQREKDVCGGEIVSNNQSHTSAVL